MSNVQQKKKCFVITPIGSETDPIRRQIEGVIDAAIRPALEPEYEIIVAHRISAPGTITKQVIKGINDADLVIANLTNKNPNVMYELAFRHSLGKPVIMIAEDDTNLPSDIIMERTIFYKNDQKGSLDLKEALKQAVKEIDLKVSCSSPIYDILRTEGQVRSIVNVVQQEYNDNGSAAVGDLLSIIVDRLESLEDALGALVSSSAMSKNNRIEKTEKQEVLSYLKIEFTGENLLEKEVYRESFRLMAEKKVHEIDEEAKIKNIKFDIDEGKITIELEISKRARELMFIDALKTLLDVFGVKNVNRSITL